MQVTTGTVDEGVFAMATRKTRLDAAVLDGITASSDGRKAGAAAETLQVGPFLGKLYSPLVSILYLTKQN